MTIYVQSAGKSKGREYKWQKVQENSLIIEDPPILKRIRVGQLIQSEKYSIVLARNDGELVLLVTGLSSDRIDFMSRPIRNSVAWVEKDSPESEQIIRSLAVLALTNKQKLEDKVNKAVVEAEATSNYRFEVNRAEINQLSELLQVQSNNNVNKDNYIGNNSVELQKKVGRQLQSYRLPNRNGILVLVTTLKTESGLEEYNVWRALSNKISYQDLIKKDSNYRNVSEEEKKNMWKIIAVAVIILIVILIIIGIVMYLNQDQ